jgi:hypothetical protein
MSQALKRSFLVSFIAIFCLILAACPADTQKAAQANHAYLVSLSNFQDAEIVLHNDGKVSDAVHLSIVKAEKVANHEAQNLDACIAAKMQGLPIDTCIDKATNAFNDLITALNLDPTVKQSLQTLADASDAALKTAIVFIKDIKSTQAKPNPAQSQQHMPISLLWAFALPMMAAGTGGVGLIGDRANAILAIVQMILKMEPIAAQALAQFLESKGRDTAAILALNKELEDKIDATADAELKKLGE